VIGKFLQRVAWRLRGWFERPHLRRVERVEELSDVPEYMERDVVVLAGPAARPKWAVFLCPCGRGHRVSLQSTHWPRWQLRLDRGRPTFFPSIDVPNEDRCHFLIVNGRIRWARTSSQRSNSR